jgi:hypothetical protein
MMATTHALAGLLVAAVATLLAPEHAPVAAVAGLAGGAFPDLDLYAGHRRTLHFPVYYALAAAPAVAIAALAPTTLTVAAAVFLAAAALHSASDALGGSLELRPWRATSDRAVYDHYHGRWIRPRRLVRYDGSPEDIALAALLGAPSLVVFDGLVPAIPAVVLGILVISVVYATLRKPMVAIAERLVRRLPPRALGIIPERFVTDLVD